MDTNLIALLSPAAALFAGLLTSLHCVGMCAPLTCLVLSPKGKGFARIRPYALYHGGRLMSYTILGALAGLLGAQLVDWTGQTPARIAPWAMAAFFTLIALGLDKRLFRHATQGGVGRSVMRRILQLRGETRALGLGLATPMLPCGPLYLFFWVAAASGSMQQGALALGVFGLGAVPAMAAAYFGWTRLQAKVGDNAFVWARRGLAVCAVAILVARTFVDLDFNAVAAGEICQ